MIKLTRFDNKEFFVNAELIQFVESRPDTIITLVSGEKIIVKEPAEEIVNKVIHYKQTINQSPVTHKKE